METKMLIEMMCKMLFNDVSKVVCIKNNEKKKTLMKSTTIGRFLNDDKRIKPSKHICELIKLRCRYYLFPFEFNTTAKEQQSEEIIKFADKVIFFLTAMFEKNYSFLKIHNDCIISEEKTNNLYIIIESFLNAIAEKECININEFSRAIEELIGYYRVSFHNSIEMKYKTDEIKNYQMITGISMNNIGEALMTQDGIIKMEQSNIRFLNEIDEIITFLEELMKCESFGKLSEGLKNKYKNNLQVMPSIDVTGKEANWKLELLNKITHNGISLSLTYDYINLTKDLITCESPNEFSVASRMLCSDIKYYNSLSMESWKQNVFYNLVYLFFDERLIYNYIDYVNYKSDYHLYINKLFKRFKRVKKLTEIYYDEIEVENFKKYTKDFYTKDDANKKRFKTNSNTWIFANEQYQKFEDILCETINYLSFQARIYDEYCIDKNLDF